MKRDGEKDFKIASEVANKSSGSCDGGNDHDNDDDDDDNDRVMNLNFVIGFLTCGKR